MKSILSWVISILSIVIIATILDMFLAEKKLGKVVRSVFSSLIVLIIISPLPALLNGCKEPQGNFIPKEIKLDQKYLEYAKSQKVRALEKGLEAALAEEGYKNIKAEITAELSDKFEISLVKLDISNLNITKGISNINKVEKIRDLTSQFLKINRDKIVIYE